jgi:hypothetical protein
MICVCKSGYVRSGSGKWKEKNKVIMIGECVSDADCKEEKECVKRVCIEKWKCGNNEECRIKENKNVWDWREGYEGKKHIQCVRVGWRSEREW